MACCVDLRIGGTEILYVHATSLGKPNFSAFLLSVQFKQTHFAFSRICDVSLLYHVPEEGQ